MDQHDLEALATEAVSDVQSALDIIIGAYTEQADGIDEKIDLLEAIDETHSTAAKHRDILSRAIGEAKEKLTHGMRRCPKCGKYTAEEQWKTESRTETSIECTHVDAGWGDDDCFGEVKRLNTYKTCPECGHEVNIDSMWLSTCNEKTRSELRSSR